MLSVRLSGAPAYSQVTTSCSSETSALAPLQVKFTGDKRCVWVTTKANAPGGVRTEKVGLPYDPELFDHMVEHGVVIEVRSLPGELPSHCLQILE